MWRREEGREKENKRNETMKEERRRSQECGNLRTSQTDLYSFKWLTLVIVQLA
jgi:hypothetical protein